MGDADSRGSAIARALWHIQQHPWEIPTIAWKNLSYPLTAGRAEAQFDRSFGVNTRRYAGAPELASEEERASAAEDYDPIPPTIARHLLNAICHAAHGSTFVDYGAGKGRMMILAASCPFEKVIGIEWSEPLVRIARENIAKSTRILTLAPIEMNLGDAADFPIPDGPCVFYFFNPFTAETTAEIERKIRRSFVNNPRKFLILSYSPPHISDIFCHSIYSSTRVTGFKNPSRFANFEPLIFETSPKNYQSRAAATYALLYAHSNGLDCEYFRHLGSMEAALDLAKTLGSQGNIPEAILEERGTSLEWICGKAEIEALTANLYSVS